MTNDRTIADLLQADRIQWGAIVRRGGSIRQIRDEAAQAGDCVLVRRATRALQRRS